MVVIGHHGIGTDVDGKGIGQLMQAFCNPALAVLIVLAGEGVFATEEGAADAATNGVAYRDVGA